MCGIVGLHLRDSSLYPSLGKLLTKMLEPMGERGPDSAGMAVYGDPNYSPPGESTVSFLGRSGTVEEVESGLTRNLNVSVTAMDKDPTTIVHAPTPAEDLVQAVKALQPTATIIGFGNDLTVLKGVGYPSDLAQTFNLEETQGWQGVAHTRMATESAVTPEGSHPFSVGLDQCLVHNGSFSNHKSIKHSLERQGVTFDSDNDTEVGARFIAKNLTEGTPLDKALEDLNKDFDGFYTLLVANSDSFAVVRDPIACKPALIAVHPRWVAMASEYRSFADLPGLEDSHIFEPEPEEVYVWHR